MDLLNELQYNFGGTKSVTEGARDGSLTYDDLKPTWFQSLLGTTQQDLDRARYQGDLQRFNESNLSQEAEQYGITVAPTGSGKINQGAIRTKVDNAKELKGLISQYRQLGGTMDTTDMSIGQVGNLIRQQNRDNNISDTQTAQGLAWNSPQAIEERRVAAEQKATNDQRYFDQQKANLRDRIDAREDKKLQFEYQKMRDRKEDMQYNERLEQLDRKDRRMAMQNLAAGLASLGAAFAM